MMSDAKNGGRERVEGATGGARVGFWASDEVGQRYKTIWRCGPGCEAVGLVGEIGSTGSGGCI